MNLLHPPTLKALCVRAGMRPSRAAGQNFLIHGGTLEAIVAAVAPTPADTIVEIGAGFGTLTTALAPHVRRLIAIERDVRVVSILREHVAPYPNVEVVAGDILAFLTGARGAVPWSPSTPWLLVANLPYSITSDFLRLLFDRMADGTLPPPARAVLLLQEEVVHRLLGSTPRDRGMLTMLAHLHCGTVRRVARIPASHFWPAPNVSSAIVVLEQWRKPEDMGVLLGGVARGAFLDVVRTAFAHRRQQLRNSLRGMFPADRMRTIDDALHSAGIAPAVRPEQLTFSQWIALVQSLSQPPGSAHA